jgi:tetratricopeptide (TPR) repeat protein
MSIARWSAHLRARIIAAQRGQVRGILGARTLLYAKKLWDQAAADPGGVPLEIAKVIAWAHWWRFRALGDPKGDEDLRSAMTLVSAIVEFDRDVVPGELLAHFDDYDTALDPQAEANSALELLATNPTEPAALARAIGMLATATSALPADDPNLPHYLGYLSDTRQKYFKHTNDLAELDRALAADKRAVALTPDGDPELPRRLILLCLTFQTLFGQSRSMAHLDESIETGRQAIAATPNDDPELATYLSILGLALRSRIAATGTKQDIDEAIALATVALRRTPPGHPELGERWAILARAGRARALRSGAVEDIDATIAATRNAVAATPADHPDLATRLSDLADALAARFERAGHRGELDEAVSTARRAVTTARPDDPELGQMLSVLGSTLRLRFDRAGKAADLDEAVDVMRRAVAVADPERANWGGWLSNLGAVLRLRFLRTRDLADLDEAITHIRAAVDEFPVSDYEHSAVLSNLAGALRMRFEESDDTGDLDEAIKAGRAAMAATSPDQRGFPAVLTNLGGLLQARFERAGTGEDIEEAISIDRQAVELTPAAHPNLAAMLGNLGFALNLRFAKTGRLTDLDEALQLWHRAAELATAPATARLRAARARAAAIASAEGPAAALGAYTAAVRLLPLLAWRETGRDDQQHVVDTATAAVARDAAACAIAAGDLGLAVELLEQGRGITWSHLLESRSDLTMLSRAYPDIAADLADCRTRLDRPDMGDDEDRRQAGRDFETLVARVRGLPPNADLPDPARFLRPPRLADLLPQRGTGRIVVVNVSSWRCDAIVLAHDGVSVVPLPRLTVEGAHDAAGRYLGTLLEFDATQGTPADLLMLEQGITDILQWLWDHIAEPLLAELGHTSTPDRDWPRLWWCPTGPLTLLPLHAAGYHKTVGRSVVDRVVSSYTPTIRALTHPHPRSPANGLLVVSLPDAPGRRVLPGARTERQLLTALFEQPTMLDGAAATHEAIVAELAEHGWFHASCHGTQNLESPLASGLLPVDWRTAGLVGIDELTGERGGEFAFLSACENTTAGVTDVDEVITIASAMHHAGWRHVVATLWSVWDDAAVAVTRGLYPRLIRHGHPDATGTARALHEVTRALRDQHVDRPSKWAPFIHTGS